KRVVAAVVEAVVIPALPVLEVEVAGEVVIVSPEVLCPADAVCVEHERAEVQVRVGDVVAASLETDEERARVVPRAAEHREFGSAAKARVERRVGNTSLLRNGGHAG